MISAKQIAAVLKLNAPERYNHFVKKVVDYEEVWGLFSDGWATTQDDKNNKLVPLWPQQEYALLNATGDWIDFEPKAILLDEFLDMFVSELQASNYGLSVFYVDGVGGVDIEICQIITDLKAELSKY
ncbi:DUF2750 domain-containing protein [Litorimonas haliclonae]|uniref:DUF2750 domain-containing protein n=1 Tax=Litorimonas haliclonae TaxID=2081977 RepID=UPI0039F03586